MPDAPTPDELAELRERHVPWRDHRHAVCAACAHTWPCDAARLLALHDADVAAIRRLEQDAGALTGIPMTPTVRENVRLLAERDEARADLARVSAARDALADRAEAAEVRLTARDGHTIVVTAAELWASHREGRELYERAQLAAAAWKRAAKGWRDGALRAVAWHAQTNERLEDANRALDALQAEHDALLARAAHAGMYPAEVAAVVAAARRAVAGADYRFPLADLRDALAALDAATQQG